jgi:hypothetical protein
MAAIEESIKQMGELEQQNGASSKDEAEDPKQIDIDNLKAELKYFYGGGK